MLFIYVQHTARYTLSYRYNNNNNNKNNNKYSVNVNELISTDDSSGSVIIVTAHFELKLTLKKI